MLRDPSPFSHIWRLSTWATCPVFWRGPPPKLLNFLASIIQPLGILLRSRKTRVNLFSSIKNTEHSSNIYLLYCYTAPACSPFLPPSMLSYKISDHYYHIKPLPLLTARQGLSCQTWSRMRSLEPLSFDLFYLNLHQTSIFLLIEPFLRSQKALDKINNIALTLFIHQRFTKGWEECSMVS